MTDFAGKVLPGSSRSRLDVDRRERALERHLQFTRSPAAGPLAPLAAVRREHGAQPGSDAPTRTTVYAGESRSVSRIARQARAAVRRRGPTAPRSTPRAGGRGDRAVGEARPFRARQARRSPRDACRRTRRPASGPRPTRCAARSRRLGGEIETGLASPRAVQHRVARLLDQPSGITHPASAVRRRPAGTISGSSPASRSARETRPPRRSTRATPGSDDARDRAGVLSARFARTCGATKRRRRSVVRVSSVRAAPARAAPARRIRKHRHASGGWKFPPSAGGAGTP